MYVAADIPVNPNAEGAKDVEEQHAVAHKPAPMPEDQYGFANPAVAFPQRTIWIPQDEHGFATDAERSASEDGIDIIAGEGAIINEKGKVEVTEDPGLPGQVDQ